jgi:hypothetical protein
MDLISLDHTGRVLPQSKNMHKQFCFQAKFDAFVKSQKMLFSVIPAKAGIQEQQGLLDPGVRRGDGFDDFLRIRQI